MASQQYANLAQSTLSSGYTAGNTTITLQTGDGAKFPANGNFVIAFNNPPDFLLLCTSRSTDTLTVGSSGIEGTTAITEPTGCKITQVISTGALNGIRSDMSQRGVSGSLPSTGQAYAGDTYIETDTGNDQFFDGSAWQKVSRGSVLLATLTASSSSELDFTGISSAFDVYEIICEDIVVSSSGANLVLQFSTNGGSSYDTTNAYAWATFLWVNNSTSPIGSSAANGIVLMYNLATGSNFSGNGEYKVHSPLNASLYKSVTGIADAVQASNTAFGCEGNSISGKYISTTAVNALRLIASTGNITSGVVYIYGRCK